MAKAKTVKTKTTKAKPTKVKTADLRVGSMYALRDVEGPVLVTLVKVLPKGKYLVQLPHSNSPFEVKGLDYAATVERSADGGI